MEHNMLGLACEQNEDREVHQKLLNIGLENKEELLRDAEVVLKRTKLALDDRDARIEQLEVALNKKERRLDELLCEKDEQNKRYEQLEQEIIKLRDLEKTLRAEIQMNRDREAHRLSSLKQQRMDEPLKDAGIARQKRTKLAFTNRDAEMEQKRVKLAFDDRDAVNEKARLNELLSKKEKETLEKDNKSLVLESDSTQTSMTAASVVNSELQKMRQNERDYMGMLEISPNEISIIMKVLVDGLKPSLAMDLLSGLPAYVTFMCICHMTNDEEKARDLLGNLINTVKKTLKQSSKEVESATLWFANMLRLMNTLEKSTSTTNNAAQCLQSFDLLENRHLLSDVSIGIYQTMIFKMQNRLQDLSLAAILEFKPLPSLSRGGKYSTRSTSVTSTSTPINALLKQLSDYYKYLHLLGVDRPVYIQVYKQLFYFICATTLNNLLRRKELCHWTNGLQIQNNLSHLQRWARDQNLVTSTDSDVTDMLLPIFQATQLLLARESINDVGRICAMCNRLSANQIIEILNLYHPGNNHKSFIEKIQLRLKDRNESKEQSNLLMDTNYLFPNRFIPF